MKKIDTTGKPIIHSIRSFLQQKKWQLLLAIMVGFTVVHAQQTPQATQQNSSIANPYKSAAITYKIIDAANGTYGYDVFVDGKLTVHQTSIPAVSGNDGFKTKEAASKVAELVISKIKKGEMPPTVSVDELKKLNAIK